MFHRTLSIALIVVFVGASVSTSAQDEVPLVPGSTIIFTKLSEDQGQNEFVVAEIYAMDPDGSNQRRITTNTTFDLFAEVSPDGKTVAFHQGLRCPPRSVWSRSMAATSGPSRTGRFPAGRPTEAGSRSTRRA